MSSDELINAFNQEPAILQEDLVSLKLGVKKRNGERFAKATTSDGRTFIKTLSKSGVEKRSVVKIPAYETKDERDSIICELSADFVQDDIADMLDISQGTVSNALKKRKNKKK